MWPLYNGHDSDKPGQLYLLSGARVLPERLPSNVWCQASILVLAAQKTRQQAPKHLRTKKKIIIIFRIVPSEKKQMQKITQRVVLFLQNAQGEQFHTNGRKGSGSWGRGGTSSERTGARGTLRSRGRAAAETA